MGNFVKKIFITIIALLSLSAFIGCSNVEFRTRLLPERVHSIYVPMARSKAYEPGLEENLTNYVVEEILADGRLDVVPEHRADATLDINIIKYDTTPKNFEGDQYPYSTDVTIVASIQLLEKGKEKPLLSVSRVSGLYTHVSDVRRTVYEPDVDAKKKALRTLAQNIVNEVISSSEYTKPQKSKDSSKSKKKKKQSLKL